MKKIYLVWVIFAYILAGCNGNTAAHGEHEHEAHEHEEGHDHDHEGMTMNMRDMIMNMKRPEKDMPVKFRLKKHWRKQSDCRRLRLSRVFLPM